MAGMRVLFLLFVALSAGPVAVAVVACAANAPDRVNVPDPPTDLQVGPAPTEAPTERPDPPSLPVPPRPDEAREEIPLSGTWAATFGHTVKYAQARVEADDAFTRFQIAAKPLFDLKDGGALDPNDFQKANAQVDLMNRKFAAAYYAPDVKKEQRIDVLERASTALLSWADRLDQLGLTKTPPSYRTDHRLALTFEEVTHGPAQRWHGEGLALANLCVDRATKDGVTGPNASNCRINAQKYAVVTTPKPKTTAPVECACNPGDPLCSATMSGWCRPTH
jgi:hypothetical protein